jgi:hypothetical protein
VEAISMPDGVVQWFDPATGDAAVVRGGRVYAARVADLEPVARHPGAHVHFDVRREEGAERAVDVTLRFGTRVSHHQGRFGTLVGDRHVDSAATRAFERIHPDVSRSFALHPLEVVRAWIDCLQAGDLDGALSLYLPEAIVHVDGDDLTGRSHIGAYLELSPLLGHEQQPEVRGEDGTVHVGWDGFELRCRVEHGMVAEQWISPAVPPSRAVEIESVAGPIAVAILAHGSIDDDEVDYAVARVQTVLEAIEDPVLFARLKLHRVSDPARDRPAIAQVSVDVDGEVVRAHVAAHEMREAADLLQRRLRAKLEQRAQRREWIRTRSGLPEPGEWRHGDLPTPRPEYFDRPVEERELVRHKTFAIDELTPDEAAFDMEQLDYQFHLFRDLASGEDAVLEHLEDGTYRLTRLHPAAQDESPVSIALSIATTTPPALTVQDATRRLDDGGEPFVFFANATSGRGNVVYRRYDGNYGLITPA